VPVKGTYDDAFRMSLEYTARHGGLNRNTAYHPLTIEGKKTVGLEIWMQNGWRGPVHNRVPTGDGVILAGVHKAFLDLRAAGLIRKLPRLICVQAEKSCAIHANTSDGHLPQRAQPGDDRRFNFGLGSVERAPGAGAVVQSRGFSLVVSDSEIIRGQRVLASTAGVFAEPAAAAAAAALGKLRLLRKAQAKRTGRRSRHRPRPKGHRRCDEGRPNAPASFPPRRPDSP
jgi:threonine synthase